MKKMLLVMAVLAILLSLGLFSCAPGGREEEVAEAEELVPGTKRFSGPYKRIAEPYETDDLGKADVEITIDASTSEFTPDKFTVKEGQVVKLILRGTDDGDLPKLTALREFTGHGFAMYGPYDIWVTGLRANVVKEVKFKATVPGEFRYDCVVWCSPDHYKMHGVMVVEPK